MGKDTKNFRQTAKSFSGNQGARNFSQVNRNPWHQRVINFINIKRKGAINGQS